MFDVGFGELVLLFVIGLLVLGPQRLPKVAAEIGKWVGRARRTATQLRRQLEREIELADLEANNPQRPAPPPAGENPTPAPGAHAGPAATPGEPATTRQISDAISEHAAAPAPVAESNPRESTDKPPAA
jgi:sec-independent protein translocase protein TatB